MPDNELIPRITVRTDEDASTVAAALMNYSKILNAHMTINGPELAVIAESSRVIELLAEVVKNVNLRDQLSDADNLPSDDEMAEGFKKWRIEFGLDDQSE